VTDALGRSGSRLTGPVLELGAGSIGMLDRLPHLAPARRLAHPVVLADLAFDALRAATVRPTEGNTAGAVCLDATRPLPVRDQSLAAVLMGELIEHVYDPRSLLRECHRVLRPAGILVLTTPNLANVQDRWRFLRGHAPRHVNPLHPYLWLHIRPFTASLLRLALQDASFQVVGVRSNYVTWRLASGRWLSWRTPARIVPSLGGSLIVLARRMNGAGGVNGAGKANG
jgi:SAM-dependent methyltransferase